MSNDNRSMKAGLTAGMALVAGLVAVPASALEPESWYVGASSDRTHIEIWRGLGWEFSDQQGGFTVRGGMNVSRRVDIELGASHATNLQWTEYLVDFSEYLTADSTFDTSALSASAIVRLNRRDDFGVYIKGGLAWSRLSGRQTLDTLSTNAVTMRSVSDRSFDYLLGGGLSVDVAPRWRVRLEYQFFGADANVLGVSDDTTVDSFSIGVDYRLGRRSADATNDSRTARR